MTVLSHSVFKPIRLVGMLFVISSAIGIIMIIGLARDTAFDTSFSVFLAVAVAWYFVSGVGILIQRPWGYFVLMLNVYLLMLGFPVGTYYGIKAKRYIEAHKINLFFEENSISL